MREFKSRPPQKSTAKRHKKLWSASSNLQHRPQKREFWGLLLFSKHFFTYKYKSQWSEPSRTDKFGRQLRILVQNFQHTHCFIGASGNSPGGNAGTRLELGNFGAFSVLTSGFRGGWEYSAEKANGQHHHHFCSRLFGAFMNLPQHRLSCPCSSGIELYLCCWSAAVYMAECNCNTRAKVSSLSQHHRTILYYQDFC